MSAQGDLPVKALRSGASATTGVPAGGFLTLGHVLSGIGGDHAPPIRLEDIRVIRHSFRSNDLNALQGPQDLTDERVLAYTRAQDISSRRFPAEPERYWVVLVADGQRRSRLHCIFENRGELRSERNDTHRFFDLHLNDFLEPLMDRLVVDWTSPRNWHRRATSAANLQVLEIADRDTVPFPGFDRVRLAFHEVKDMVEDHRYADWRAALSEVQGIYLITDSTNGKQYVGKADGAERILGRWTVYARDGHGGNVALRELAFASTGDGLTTRVSTEHARHFVFSILR
ncbi:MAG: hypothetical protein ABIS84_10885, partial [Arachnia sp.]